MTRNISSSFSEIKIDTDIIRKYLGVPIILQLSEDPKLRLENIQFIYISKQRATLEQMQDMFVNPQ
jgi:hypothetical protein